MLLAPGGKPGGKPGGVSGKPPLPPAAAAAAVKLVTQPALFDGKFPAHEVLEPSKAGIVRYVQDVVRSLSPHGAFPGPNPCSLERADLPKLGRQRYWLCDKTDGTRALLAFITFEGTKLAVLVTRGWDVHVVGIQHVPRALFQGTVFDGEVVCIEDRWCWLGFDAACVAGVPVWASPLSERLAAARRGLTAYHPAPKDRIEVRFKTYYATMAEYRARDRRAHGPADGVVLTPEDMPIVLGRHHDLFKLKDSGKHTVDFQFLAPRSLCVWCPKVRGVQVVAEISLPAPLPPSGTIIEAVCDPRSGGGGWSLVTYRADKKTSNDMLTYQKTMLNARENLRTVDVEPYFS